MIIASAIRMKASLIISNNLLEIDKVFLDNYGWFSKEYLHNYVLNNPGSIRVGSASGPKLVPVTSIHGEKYVKSFPNNSIKDNLLELPRR